MTLYKALAADMKSYGGFGPWVKNEWQTQPAGELNSAVKGGVPYGLHCSNDVLIALESTHVPEYICKVETAGDSILPGQTRKGETIVSDDGPQVWRQMRVTHVWAWPKAEVQGLAVDAEWLVHSIWAMHYPDEAAAWQSAMDGQQYDQAATIALSVFMELHALWGKPAYNERTLRAAQLALFAARIAAAPAAWGGGGLARLANTARRYVPPNQTDPPDSGAWEPLHLWVQWRLEMLPEL